MEKNEREKAFKSAEKDLKEKEIEKFKEVVKITLEKLELRKEQRHAIDKEIQILKKDVDDLKAGRLHKIAERQDKDEEADDISVFRVREIIKEVPVPYPTYPNNTPWYRPWEITWCDSTCDEGVAGGSSCFTLINASEAKYNTPGSYALSNGTVKNI